MQLEKLQDQKPECHLEWPNYSQHNYSLACFLLKHVLMSCDYCEIEQLQSHLQKRTAEANCKSELQKRSWTAKWTANAKWSRCIPHHRMIDSFCITYNNAKHRVFWSLHACPCIQHKKSTIMHNIMVVWGPDLFLRGGRGKRERRSGDSCSTAVCSWNVNREETVILEVIKKE